MIERNPFRAAPNWGVLLAAILIAAPFLRALWHVLLAVDAAGPQLSGAGWLALNANLLLSGALVAGIFVADSLRFERPSRGFLLTLAACLLALGIGSAVFTIGIELDTGPAHRLSGLRFAGPILAAACCFGVRFCLQRAFPANAR